MQDWSLGFRVSQGVPPIYSSWQLEPQYEVQERMVGNYSHSAMRFLTKTQNLRFVFALGWEENVNRTSEFTLS